MLTVADIVASPAALIGLVVTSVILYFLVPRKAANSDAPPMVTSSPVVKIPLIGQIIEFGLGPINMVSRCYKEYGPVFTVAMGKERMTFLIGPEAQGAFCKASDEVLSQDEVYKFMKPVFGPGVVYDATKKRRQVQFSSMANGLRTSRLKA